MNPGKINISNNILLGHGAFLVLFFLAVFFYLERTLYVDTSYMTFNLLHYKDFFCAGQRYAAQIPQALPLLAIKLHLPLKLVLGIYSVSFILLYYLVFLIIAYVLKNDKLAIAVPLVLLLGVKYSFFWTVTETHQALVYTVLLTSFLYYSQKMKPGIKNLILKLIIATGIIFLCFFSHPVAFFPVLFILGYFLIDQKLWKNYFVYILAAILFAMTILKVFLIPTNSYDTAVYDDFFSILSNPANLFKSQSLIFFIGKIFNIYFFSLIIFIVTTLFYILKKQYLKLAFYLVSVILFLFIIFMTFSRWFYPFIQEKNIIPLNIFLLIPFLNEVIFSSRRLTILRQVFLIILFAVAVVHIVSASGFYTNRIAYVRSLINSTKKFPEKKFIIKQKDIDMNQVNVRWAFAVESLLFSSLNGPDSSRSIFVPDEGDDFMPDPKLNNPMLFICVPWSMNLNIGKMDKHYFNLENSAYRILALEDFYTKNKRTIYSNIFDKPLNKKSENYGRDSTGNSFYILTSEFSPGMTKMYTDLSSTKSILLSATVKVCPVEEVNPQSLKLVICREQKGVAYDYYSINSPQPYIPESENWTILSVSGIVRNTDKNDKVKIYLWNPERKKIKMDDFVICYTTE